MNSSTDKELSDLCYNELDMCCQTLCNKQEVYNYIKHLEERVKTLEEALDAKRNN